jgi:citrate lyase subunit beta/citryl-CoA lyase/(S)-citramalyl-CoA lyase
VQYLRECRSVLFTSALHPHRFDKAQAGTGADVNLVDCEDSVAAGHKARARSDAAAFFGPPARRRSRLAVRINALTEGDGLADLLAIREWPYAPDLVLVPKVESARDLEIVARVLAGSGVRCIALIETPRGVQRVAEIADGGPHVWALLFGSADFSNGINATTDWEGLAHARSVIVLAARAAGIHAIDTPTFDLADPARLAEDTRRAQRMGFSGKCAIHPSQVPVINAGFSPDAASLRRARQIVAGADANGGDVCVVDGQMVGVPIVESARRTLLEFA